MNEFLSNQIQLFKSVFKGREDVFAIRWEKGNKSGYIPAYHYAPYILNFNKNLVLTKNGMIKGKWDLPEFFKEFKISYHKENSFENGAELNQTSN